jgi:hypothetical protein
VRPIVPLYSLFIEIFSEKNQSLSVPGDPLGDSVGGINISSDLHADDAEFESYGFGDIDFALFDPDPPLQDELASQRRLAEGDIL